MKLFKKKHKRSEWYEGLLEAEKLYSEGYHYHKNDGTHIWFKSRNLGWSEESGVYITYNVNDPWCIGIMDYLSYKEEYL